jgi:glycosyltransferase involved in cell wall biosynthesis
VLLESAALGVPIAAMDTGGTADIIRHGESGLLAATAEELGAAVTRLVRDRGLAARLGAGGREHVRVMFGASRVADRIEALYHSLLDARMASRARSAG